MEYEEYEHSEEYDPGPDNNQPSFVRITVITTTIAVGVIATYLTLSPWLRHQDVGDYLPGYVTGDLCYNLDGVQQEPPEGYSSTNDICTPFVEY